MSENLSKFFSLAILLIMLIFVVILNVCPIVVPNGLDKIVHYIGFFMFSGYACFVYVKMYGKKYFNFFLVRLLIYGAVLATITELSQKYASLRSCDVYDWLYDIYGIASAGIFAYFVNLTVSHKAEVDYDEAEFLRHAIEE